MLSSSLCLFEEELRLKDSLKKKEKKKEEEDKNGEVCEVKERRRSDERGNDKWKNMCGLMEMVRKLLGNFLLKKLFIDT